MKKCNRYLDALEEISGRDPAGWQDVVVHASKCPDCSSDMKLRTQMLEMMAESPDPAFPENLHAAVMERIVSEGSEPEISNEGNEGGFFARLFDFALQPLEIAIPLACLLMFVFLMQIDKDPALAGKGLRNSVAARVKVAAKSEDTGLRPLDQGLEKVTVAEVQEFHKQLEAFRRLHPETRQPVNYMVPAATLVNDEYIRRQP